MKDQLIVAQADKAGDKGASGFKLPQPGDKAAAAPSAPAAAAPAGAATGTTVTTTTTETTSVQVSSQPIEDTSSRDMAIGGAILLVLFIVFFFVKNGYANSLVAKKVAPRAANAAGWWLFVFLASLATAGVLGFVNQAKFLNLFFLGPLTLVAIVGLVMALLTGRR